MHTLTRKSLVVVFILVILMGGFVASYYYYQNYPKEIPVKKFKIGIIIDNPIFLSNIEGFKSKLDEIGYKENKNVEYVLRDASSQQNLREQYAKELVDSNLNLIISGSNIATRELKKLTNTIPIIFVDIGNTVGIVDNLSAPEGNITGITGGNVDYTGKRLEILKELAPHVKKVVISPDKNFPNYVPYMKFLNDAAKKLNVQIVEMPSSNAKEFVSRAPSIINKKNGDAFMVFTGPNNAINAPQDRQVIIAQLKKEKMLAITHNMELGANIGMLIAYGVYRRDVGQEAAVIADRVLKGEPIKNIPVATPLKSVVLEINLQTARDIGVEIPQSLLLQTNKTYQN